MNNLFNLQRELMEKLGVKEGEGVFSPLFKDMLICMNGEVSEALAPLANGTKPWKQGDEALKIEADIKEEVVDVFFFLMEAWLVAGWEPEDFEKIYIEKYNKNLARIESAKKIVELKEAGYTLEKTKAWQVTHPNGNKSMVTSLEAIE